MLLCIVVVRVMMVDSWVEAATGGGGGLRQGARGDAYEDKINIISDLCGDTGVLGFWDPPRLCVYDVHIVNTDLESYDGRYPHHIQSQNAWQKRANILRWQLNSWLIPFQTNGIGNNWKHSGISGPVFS